MGLLEDIQEAVVDGDAEKAAALAQRIIDEKLDLNNVIVNGLNEGMRQVSILYDKREYFLPEIIVAADALYEALELFKPHLKADQEHKAIVVCGVVRGDIHDIGKNVVKLFLEAAGYKVIDLGRNVPAEAFIETIKNYKADVLALSSFLSPTLENMAEVIDMLKSQDLYAKVKIIIGGAAPDEKFAEEIGATYFNDATAAIEYLNTIFSGGK